MAIAAGESYVSHYIHRYRFYDEFPYGLYAFKACGKIPASGRKTFSVHDIRCIWIFCILPASLCTFQDHSSCGCTDPWRLRFFYGGICIPAKKGGLLAKTILSMYLTAFVVGGIYQALETEKTMTVKIFLLFTAGIYGGLYTLICAADFIRLGRKNIYPVILKYQGRVQQSYGFFDTGNLLMDPVNRQPVSIIKPELLEKILSSELTEKLMYIKEEPQKLKSTELSMLQPHFLSFRGAGGKEGIMLAVVLGELEIQTPGRVVHVGKPVLAITSEPSALGEEYGILLNSRLLH